MIFSPDIICDPELDFDEILGRVYAHQMKHNEVYRRFYEDISDEINDAGITKERVPLLPIEAFRDARIYAAGDKIPDLHFQSSGTTTTIRSQHFVAYSEMYSAAIFAGLECFYAVENFVVLAYTPGYNENPHSSLVWMINALIDADASGLSRFLKIGEPLDERLITEIYAIDKRVMLFGAAFGLADLAEKHPVYLPEGSIIIETGGMKTYRKEMSRSELHNVLADGFGVRLDQIHSEYGMTELLSQAYSSGDMWFRTPPWMHVSIRDPLNPMQILNSGEEGLIGIIDLANWASCPFLLTGDRGIQRVDGAFQVLGRWSDYHLRGCNFLLEAD